MSTKFNNMTFRSENSSSVMSSNTIMQLSLLFDKFHACPQEVTIDHSYAIDDCQISETMTPVGAAPTLPAASRPPSPDFGIKAPSVRPISTLAHVRQALEHRDDLPMQHRRDLYSALKRLPGLLDRKLDMIPTEPAALRDLLDGVYPASHGMTPARWRNIRALTAEALRQAGVTVRSARSRLPLSPAWAALYGRLTTKKLRIGLSSLMHYCSETAVTPETVNMATFDAFGQALATQSLSGKPGKAAGLALRLWNQAAAEVEAWPGTALPVPASDRVYARDLNAYPQSFQDDVAAYLDHRGDPDPLSDDYLAPLRPSTLEHRRTQIRRMAEAVVASGVAVDAVTHLGVLVEPANAKAALRFFLNRAGGQKLPWVSEMALLLKLIARDWMKADAQQVAALARICQNLSAKRKGMTSRNRARLRQFDNAEALLSLLNLPRKVCSHTAAHDDNSRLQALRAMHALAIELLIVAPMRINNLTGLVIDRHIVHTNRGRHPTVHVIIPADEMKNNQPFEVQLAPTTAAMLATYLKLYRPRVSSVASHWLFPNEDGKRRSNVAFSRALSNLVKRETGIVMHMHLFRHLAIKLHLGRHPDDIETGRRLLGHKNSSTTARFYAEFKTDAAFQRYDDLIASLRDAVAEPAPKATKSAKKKEKGA